MLRVPNLIKSTLERNDPKSPDCSILIWNLINRCNLSLHCYFKASIGSKDTLTIEDKIVNTSPSLINAGIKFVIFFSSREPLLKKDFLNCPRM